MAEEIGFESGRNSNFEGLVIRPYGIPSCITHRPLPIYQISFKSKKLFVEGRTDGRTDGRTFSPYIIRSTFGSRPKNHQWASYIPLPPFLPCRKISRYTHRTRVHAYEQFSGHFPRLFEFPSSSLPVLCIFSFCTNLDAIPPRLPRTSLWACSSQFCLTFYLRVSAVLATATCLVAGWWLAVPLRYCIKMAKPIWKLFRPSESPIILVSCDPCADTQF